MAFLGNTLGNLPVTSGKIIFVDSGSDRASDGNAGRDPNVPMATIDAAVARCSANNGDIIVVMPGHSEAPTATTTLDVAGVWVYGLGWGGSRPVIDPVGATAFTVSAANCRISNIVFDLQNTTATNTACVQTSAADTIIENCESRQHATSQYQFMIQAVAGADRLQVLNCKWNSLAATGSSSAFYLDGVDDIIIKGNVVTGHFGLSLVNNATGPTDEVLNATFIDNYFHNDSSTAADLVFDMDDDATGICARNMLSGGLALAANNDFGSMRVIETYITDAIDVSAVIPLTGAS